MLFEFKKETTLSYINFSNNFENAVRRLIGRSFFNRLESEDLNTGTTLATFI
jgi:hypothetical protein